MDPELGRVEQACWSRDGERLVGELWTLDRIALVIGG
jgi:hypothetical protein